MNEASEDESEEELPPRKSRKTSSKPASEPAPLPRQSILGSDDSEDEDQEQDLDSSDDEEMATQSRSASERRGGTVEEIILENFMCHKHLKTTLGPKINFLTGPNGSKSCVFTSPMRRSLIMSCRWEECGVGGLGGWFGCENFLY